MKNYVINSSGLDESVGTFNSAVGNNLDKAHRCFCKRSAMLAIIAVAMLCSSERAYSPLYTIPHNIGAPSSHHHNNELDANCEDIVTIGAAVICAIATSPIWVPPVAAYFTGRGIFLAGRGISREIVRRGLYKETTFLKKNVDSAVQARLGEALDQTLAIGISAVNIAYELKETVNRAEETMEKIEKAKKRHENSQTLERISQIVESFRDLLSLFSCLPSEKEMLSANNAFGKIGKAIEILIKNKKNKEEEEKKISKYLESAINALTTQQANIAANSKKFIEKVTEMLDSPEGSRCISNFVSKNEKLCKMFQKRQTSVVNRDRSGLYDYACSFDNSMKNIQLILNAFNRNSSVLSDSSNNLLLSFIKLNNAYEAIRYDLLLPITIMTYISNAEETFSEKKEKIMMYIEKAQKEKAEVDEVNSQLMRTATEYQNVNQATEFQSVDQ